MALYHSSNVLGRANKDAPWEIWRVPRFPSCKLTSHKPVTARSMMAAAMISVMRIKGAGIVGGNDNTRGKRAPVLPVNTL
jgi:hypothetical protein